jgi:hypothetical protein
MIQTIHIDDLSRNFALNPGEGLKVGGHLAVLTRSAPSKAQVPKLAYRTASSRASADT